MTGFSNCSNLFKPLFSGILFLTFFIVATAGAQPNRYPVELNRNLPVSKMDMRADTAEGDTLGSEREFPKPTSVLYKSLMVPGWGQITNKQAWKVPIVYALLGGLAWYSVELTKQYHDYRAAYYNATSDEGDLRFGPTPAYISPDASPDQLRNNRNRLRNRRDFVYIAIGLAYGLNAIDAYVFAHMRSFDVSDDLSLNTRIKPALFENSSPGITLSIDLVKRSSTR